MCSLHARSLRTPTNTYGRAATIRARAQTRGRLGVHRWPVRDATQATARLRGVRISGRLVLARLLVKLMGFGFGFAFGVCGFGGGGFRLDHAQKMGIYICFWFGRCCRVSSVDGGKRFGRTETEQNGAIIGRYLRRNQWLQTSTTRWVRRGNGSQLVSVRSEVGGADCAGCMVLVIASTNNN